MGKNTFCFSIGPLTMEAYSGLRALPKKLTSEFKIFKSFDKPPFKIIIDISRKTRVKTNGLVKVAKRNGIYFVKREDFQAHIDTAAGAAKLFVQNNYYSINSFLRVLASILMPTKNACLIHASGVILKQQAYIFIGKSGAGKTTVARNCSEADSLGDEMVGLHVNGSAFKAFSTPFGGELESPRRNISVPTAALYLLNKSTVESIANIEPSDCFDKLLRCIVNFSKEKEDVARVFKLAGKIIDNIPFYKLNFKANTNFRRVLESTIL